MKTISASEMRDNLLAKLGEFRPKVSRDEIEQVARDTSCKRADLLNHQCKYDDDKPCLCRLESERRKQ